MEKITKFLKEKWWLAPILLIIIVLWLIPIQGGLPGENYVGCDVEGALCQYSTIKSIAKESNGSTTLIFSAKISDIKSQDLTYTLSRSTNGYAVGNTVFMNYSPDDHRMVLFVGYKSNLLIGLTLDQISSPAATAVIDTNTGKEIDS